MKKTYEIEYIVYLTSGKEDHIMKVKNNESELQAKIRLEVYLKKKYPNFLRLEIKSCTEDVVSFLGDIFGFK